MISVFSGPTLVGSVQLFLCLCRNIRREESHDESRSEKLTQEKAFLFSLVTTHSRFHLGSSAGGWRLSKLPSGSGPSIKGKPKIFIYSRSRYIIRVFLNKPLLRMYSILTLQMATYYFTIVNKDP